MCIDECKHVLPIYVEQAEDVNSSISTCGRMPVKVGWGYTTHKGYVWDKELNLGSIQEREIAFLLSFFLSLSLSRSLSFPIKKAPLYSFTHTHIHSTLTHTYTDSTYHHRETTTTTTTRSSRILRVCHPSPPPIPLYARSSLPNWAVQQPPCHLQQPHLSVMLPRTIHSTLMEKATTLRRPRQ